jgi:hypothetical protein
MYWSLAYVCPDKTVEGKHFATWSEWVQFGAWVIDRHHSYDDLAYLCQEGWQDNANLIGTESELSAVRKDVDSDRLIQSIAARLLESIKARPENCIGIVVTDFESTKQPTVAESVFFSEDHAGLVQKQVTVKRSDGTEFQQKKWVKANDDKSKSEPASPEPKEDSKLSGEDAKEIERTIEDTSDYDFLPPEDRPSKGLLAKCGDIALTAAAKSLMFVHKLSELQIGKMKLGGLAVDIFEAIFDTPSDLKKFGYNPTAMGKDISLHKNPDAFSTALQDNLGFGISGHLGAKIISTVLVKAAYWISGKIKGKPEVSESADEQDGYQMWGEFIKQLMLHVASALDLDGVNPDANKIAEILKQSS